MSVVGPPRFLVASSGPLWSSRPHCLRASVGSTDARSEHARGSTQFYTLVTLDS